MKISIIGEKARAATWEKHLRKLSVINEVIFTSSLAAATDTDAVFLIDDSDSFLNNLYNSIRSGYHTYLISRLPVDSIMLEKIYASRRNQELLYSSLTGLLFQNLFNGFISELKNQILYKSTGELFQLIIVLSMLKILTIIGLMKLH